MADLYFANRVQETALGSGLDNQTLQGAATGWRAFSDCVPVGERVSYCIVDGEAWEIGEGTLVSSTELSRDTITDSSATADRVNNIEAGTPIKLSLSTGTHTIILTGTAQNQVYTGAGGAVADATPFRASICVETIALMKADNGISDNELIFAKHGTTPGDGLGGWFYFDDDDATAPDNVDTFRNDNYGTGLHKRIYIDKQVPSKTDMTGALARSLRWLSGISRLAFGAATLFWEIPLTKGGFFVGIHATVSALKGIDAAAQHTSGQYAMVLGVSGFGDCKTFVVEWSSSSSATADDTNVFRPTTGAASSGNGRWLRSTSSRSRSFTSSDATPSIANGDYFVTAGTTNITKFDDGFEGQFFSVKRGASDIVIEHDAAKINLAGYNIRLTDRRPTAFFQMIGGIAVLLACDVIHDDFITMADLGGKPNDDTFDNAAAINRWKVGVLAGSMPSHLEPGPGIWFFLSAPDELDDAGILRISGESARTEFRQHYSASDEFTGLLVLRGGTSHSIIEDIQFATSAGCLGGSGVLYRGNADLAPSEARMRGCSFTTYTNKSNFAITGATNAAQGVFTTSGSHSFANGEALCSQHFGPLWPTLEKDLWEASDVTSTTFKMKKRGTGTYCDTSALGAFSSGTVRSAEAFHVNIHYDGVDKDTGAIGDRVMKVDSVEMFGCSKWAIKCNGVSTLLFMGSTIYPAGFNAYIWASGTVDVPTSDLYSYGSKIHGYILDRCVGARHFGDISGSIFTTANTTADIRVWGEIGGIVDDESKLIKDLATRVVCFTAADRYVYSTTSGVALEGVITSAGRGLLDDATFADQRTTLSVPGLSTTNAMSGFNSYLRGSATTGPATTGNSTTNIALRTGASNVGVSGWGIDFGMSVNGDYAWIQARDFNDYSQNAGLKINQNGGNLLIGGDFLPIVTESQDIGSASFEFDNAFLQNAVTVSDERRKNDLGEIDGDQAIEFIKALIPRWFTFKPRVIPATTETLIHDEPVLSDDGEPATDADGRAIVKRTTKVIQVPERIIQHKRPHAGFFAQQFKAAMTQARIKDFAGYAYDEKSDTHLLRLLELSAMQAAAMRKMIARIERLEGKKGK